MQLAPTIQQNTAPQYSRSDYLNNRCTHRQYYSQFVTDTIKAIVQRRIGLKRLLDSTDPALNDIPLKQWDSIQVYSHVGYSLKAAGDGFSIVGNVCILKEAAQEIIEEYKANLTAAPTALSYQFYRTYYALQQLGGYADIYQIIQLTGRHRTNETKTLKALAMFGVIRCGADANNKRRKVYVIAKKAELIINGA